MDFSNILSDWLKTFLGGGADKERGWGGWYWFKEFIIQLFLEINVWKHTGIYKLD